LEKDMVAIRSILYPSVETVYEYYRMLIGVKTIEIEMVAVPSTFHVELIGAIGDPDVTFPAYDIALPKKNVKGYRALIQRIIVEESERNRLGVRNLLEAAPPDDSVVLSKETKLLFASLNHVSSVLESVVTGGKLPDIVGWMLSPRHTPTKDRYGIKLLTDSARGTKWDSLLGTREFPDFVISRRITSASWTFQHPATTKMLTSIMEWWGTAHMQSKDGWIHSSETDLDALLEIFRTKGVPTVYHAERMDTVRSALLEIEETVLGNPEIYTSTTLIRFSTSELWRGWIDCMFRSKGVMLDSNVDFIQAIIQRWMRDGWGIRTECLPAPRGLPAFRDAWTALVRLRSADESSILQWISLLNMNDPVYTIRVTHEQKQQILDEWIPVAASLLKASNSLTRAKIMPTYAWIQKWILQFVPASLFKTFMLPKRMQSSIVAEGYAIIHSTGGYFFVGLELPASEEELTAYGGKEEVD
jgi:hypothetical protein